MDLERSFLQRDYKKVRWVKKPYTQYIVDVQEKLIAMSNGTRVICKAFFIAS